MSTPRTTRAGLDIDRTFREEGGEEMSTTITYTRTTPGTCTATKGDGEPCAKQGKELHEGKGWLCGLHARPINLFREQRIQELKRYADYQKIAFAAVVRTWSDDRLREREAATRPGTIRDDMREERQITIRAEHAAVVAEIARRRAS